MMVARSLQARSFNPLWQDKPHGAESRSACLTINPPNQTDRMVPNAEPLGNTALGNDKKEASQKNSLTF